MRLFGGVFDYMVVPRALTEDRIALTVAPTDTMSR